MMNRESRSRSNSNDSFRAALMNGPRPSSSANPWDVGTARLLASMGFEALATTSAGYAFSRGVPDGGVAFEEMINHCRELVNATRLPVSADLENGKGDSPESAAETVFAAAKVGACRLLHRGFFGRSGQADLRFRPRGGAGGGRRRCGPLARPRFRLHRPGGKPAAWRQ